MISEYDINHIKEILLEGRKEEAVSYIQNTYGKSRQEAEEVADEIYIDLVNEELNEFKDEISEFRLREEADREEKPPVYSAEKEVLKKKKGIERKYLLALALIAVAVFIILLIFLLVNNKSMDSTKLEFIGSYTLNGIKYDEDEFEDIEEDAFLMEIDSDIIYFDAGDERLKYYYTVKDDALTIELSSGKEIVLNKEEDGRISLFWDEHTCIYYFKPES